MHAHGKLIQPLLRPRAIFATARTLRSCPTSLGWTASSELLASPKVSTPPCYESARHLPQQIYSRCISQRSTTPMKKFSMNSPSETPRCDETFLAPHLLQHLSTLAPKQSAAPTVTGEIVPVANARLLRWVIMMQTRVGTLLSGTLELLSGFRLAQLFSYLPPLFATPTPQLDPTSAGTPSPNTPLVDYLGGPGMALNSVLENLWSQTRFNGSGGWTAWACSASYVSCKLCTWK